VLAGHAAVVPTEYEGVEDELRYTGGSLRS
jgi:hypothetical protein